MFKKKHKIKTAKKKFSKAEPVFSSHRFSCIKLHLYCLWFYLTASLEKVINKDPNSKLCKKI